MNKQRRGTSKKNWLSAIAAQLDEDVRKGAKIVRAAEMRYADPDRHLVLSHGDWVKIAQRAKITGIPTWTCENSTLAKADIFGTWDQDKEARTRTSAAQGRINARADELEAATGGLITVRCDFCAPSHTKEVCAHGRKHSLIAGPQAREAHNAIIADLRVADLLGGWPRLEVPVHLRPYVAPAIHLGWPVELRVWVWNGTIRAVANYYPQRSLEECEDVQAMIASAIRQTQQLIDCAPKFDPIPLDPEALCEAVTFTADFLKTAQGETLWLECGPYTFPNGGAHPCAVDDPGLLWETRDTPLIVLGAVARHETKPATQ